MNWDQAQIDRFTNLRQRQLIGLLSEAERVELAAMIKAVEQAEEAQLASTVATMRAEAIDLQTKLHDLRQENQELAQLQIQLHMLVTDAR